MLCGSLCHVTGALCSKLSDNLCVLCVLICGSVQCLVLYKLPVLFEVNNLCIGWGNVLLLYKNINFVRLSVYKSSICMIPICLYLSLIYS